MSKLQTRDSIGRNASVVLLGQVITWLTTAITLAIIPRNLGAHDMGVYSIGVTFLTLATAIGGLGMGTLITRDVARDRTGTSQMVSSALWLNLGLGLVAGAVAVAVAYAAGYSTSVIIVVALLAATAPLSLFGAVIGSTLTGLEIMRWNVAIDVSSKAIFLFGAIIALVFHTGLLGVIAATLSCSIIVFLAQIVIARKSLGLESWVMSLESLKYLLRQSIPFFLVSVAWVIYTSIDVIMLSWFGGEESVGIYATPMRIFGTALFVPITITTVLFPRLSAMFTANSNEMASLAARVLRLSVSVSVLMALASVALSDPLVVSLLGKSFVEDTGPVVLVLSASLIPTSISIVASRMAFAANRQAAVAWIGFSAFAVKAALGVFLIPFFESHFGNAALGAAVVLLIAESAMVLAMLRFLPPGTFMHAAPYYARLGVSGTLAVGVCVLAYGETAIGASLAAVATYGLMLVALRVVGRTQVRAAVEFLRHTGGVEKALAVPAPGVSSATAKTEGLGMQ